LARRARTWYKEAVAASDQADLTLDLLRSIRDEISGLRADTNALRVELKVEIGATNERLDRVERGLLDLGKFMRELDMAKYERFHTHHVEILEKDLEDVKARLRRLEERA
jgi:cob(I)alamin adenosyltransferase